MSGPLGNDRLQVSVGGRSGRSVGFGFLVEPAADELEGVEEVIEGRPFAQVIGAGLGIVGGVAGAGCLVAPLLGENLTWLLAGAFLLAWAGVVFRKALRIRPDRVLVYGDRLAIYRWGQKAEYRWSEISHVEHITHVNGDSTHRELRLYVVSTLEQGSIPLASEARYGDLGRLLEAIQKHCDVRFEEHGLQPPQRYR